jgi:tRNA(Leu) C34 or U34 (ribose-2'-O)-methylase TrmL
MNDPIAVIGLLDPKSPANVGAVMRAAGCYQAHSVYFTGVRYPRAASYNTDTKNVARDIPLTGVASLLESLPEATRAGTKIVCVELVVGATPLPLYQHPPRAFYLFGPEDGTLDQGLIDRADDVIYVPTIGCMNLAATVNVVLYDRMAKLSPQRASDALILRSRDTNNRVKLRPRLQAPLAGVTR